MKPPIPNTYWVIPGKFLAGEYPRHKEESASLPKMQAYHDEGIDIFIDLTESHELASYDHLLQGAERLSFPIRDVSVPQSIDYTQGILDVIDEKLALGKTIYVHCWGGIGRTGLIVGCWLARQKGSGDAGYRELLALWQKCSKSARTGSPETDAQARYIQRWV